MLVSSPTTHWCNSSWGARSSAFGLSVSRNPSEEIRVRARDSDLSWNLNRDYHVLLGEFLTLYCITKASAALQNKSPQSPNVDASFRISIDLGAYAACQHEPIEIDDRSVCYGSQEGTRDDPGGREDSRAYHNDLLGTKTG